MINAVSAGLSAEYLDCRAVADRRSFSIFYRKAVIDFIKDLHESGRVEVRWLTTWCEYARDNLAPEVGLPGDFVVEGSLEHNTIYDGWWKAHVAKRIAEAEPDRPIIWTDDDLDYGRRRGEIPFVTDWTAPKLLICPDTNIGLTDADLNAILAFVNRLEGCTQATAIA